MYMSGEFPLKDLEQQIFGYITAIQLNNISEDVLDFNTGLNDYILKKFQWSTACGWADSIIRNTENSEQSIQLFFKITNNFIEYKYGQKNAINENNCQ